MLSLIQKLFQFFLATLTESNSTEALEIRLEKLSRCLYFMKIPLKRYILA